MDGNMQEGNIKEKLEQHPFLLLSFILVLIAVLVNVIPSGVYERVAFEGRTIVDAESYAIVDKKYSGIEDFFLSFYYGFQKASGLIAMVLFVGGAFGVVKRIGLMDTAVKYMAFKLKDSNFITIALVVMPLVGLQVCFTGMWELSLVIIPLIVPLCLRLGYDVMVGAAMVIIASAAGFGASFTNPFFTAIAHQIAELPIYSGIWYRALTFVILLFVGIFYLYFYAKKVKEDPSKSYLTGIKAKYEQLDDEIPVFTPALKRAGGVFVLLFGFLIYGTVNKGFAFAEMSAVFVAIGILVGLAYGASPNKICHMFAQGMGDLMIAALVIFFARAILFVMEQTLVIDSVIHFLSQFAEGSSIYASAVTIFIVQTLINGVIPSGSGQAAITMPIMVPLADISGVMRQVACYASQLGDGLSNFIYPTNGGLIAVLSVAGIPYLKWFKFFGPLFGIYTVISMILVAIAQAIGYGPF